MIVTNQRLVEILTTAIEKPEITNALIQRVINTLNKQPEPDYSKAGFGKSQNEEGCAGCGKQASEGWALYCVKCSEREWQGLTDMEAEQIIDEHWEDLLMLMEAIEAKLKEKNT